MRGWKVGDRVKCTQPGTFTPDGDVYGKVGTIQSFDGASVRMQFSTGMVCLVPIESLINVTKPPKREEDDWPIGAQIAERQRTAKKTRRRTL